MSPALAFQQFLLGVRQVVEVCGFLKVFAVAAHQDFVAGNIQKGLPVHLDLRCQEIHHRMRDDRQGGLIFSGPLLHIPQKGQGLRHLRVDHPVCLVAYQKHTLSAIVAHLLPAPGQQIEILRPLDVIRCVLQAVGIQADKMGVGLQRAVPVPKEAVAAFGGVIQQHGKVTEHRIVRVGLGFLFNQAVEIFHDGKIRRFELANVRVPEDTELMI